MSYCPNCGLEVKEDATICPRCRTKVNTNPFGTTSTHSFGLSLRGGETRASRNDETVAGRPGSNSGTQRGTNGAGSSYNARNSADNRNSTGNGAGGEQPKYRSSQNYRNGVNSGSGGYTPGGVGGPGSSRGSYGGPGGVQGGRSSSNGAGSYGGPGRYTPNSPDNQDESFIDRIRNFFTNNQDGSNNRYFLVAGGVLLVIVMLLTGSILYGIFIKDEGDGQIASNTGNTSSKNKPKLSPTGEDHTDPHDDMDKYNNDQNDQQTGSKDRSSDNSDQNTDADDQNTNNKDNNSASKDRNTGSKEKSVTGNQGNNTGNKDTSSNNKDNKGTSSQTTQNTGNQTNEDHAKKNTTSQDTGNQSGSQDTGKKNTGNQNTSDQNTGDQNTGSQDTDDQAGVGDANLSREELLERERDSRDYLYGTAHTGYIMDPSSSNGYDISEIPEDALGYYYSDFDEDGEDELLVLDQTGERFVRLNMYEVEDQTVVQADSVLAECDAYNDGSVKEFTVSEGVPAFADAFVYQCGGETRIGFEFAASGIHATGTSHDILSYRYSGGSFELVDYSHNAGSTIAEDVVNDAAYAAEYTADLAKLGVGAMTPQDVASYWNCDTHIMDYMQDVHEIFRAETDFDGDASTLYSNWESGGKARMAFSTIRFWSDGDLFEGDGSLYKDPSTVETKEATDNSSSNSDDDWDDGGDDYDDGGNSGGGNSGSDNSDDDGWYDDEDYDDEDFEDWADDEENWEDDWDEDEEEWYDDEEYYDEDEWYDDEEYYDDDEEYYDDDEEWYDEEDLGDVQDEYL